MRSFSDRKSPIAYGYDETLPIYFNQAPLFQVASCQAFWRRRWRRWRCRGPGNDRQAAAALTDPDIVQGMPQAVTGAVVASPRPGEEQINRRTTLQLGAILHAA